MRIIFSTQAEKELRRLPKLDQIAISQKIRMLENISLVGEEKLKGYKNIFRARVGDYRIVYRRKIEEIYIVLIGYRKDIYRILDKLLK